MSKSQRLIELMMTINTKRKFTVKELANEFGVSSRTILRDLQELSELGVPLYSEVGPHGGYQVLRERILPPIIFSEDEAIAMFFAYQSLQRYTDLPFETQSISALKKFYHYLPSDVKYRIDQMSDRMIFWVDNYNLTFPYLKDLLQASIEQKVVSIAYDSKSGINEREIQPIGVYTVNGLWYCPAYCFHKGGYRLFRVDRVQSLQVEENQSRRKDLNGFKIKDWFKPYEIPNTLNLSVKLSRNGVRRCKTDPFLEKALTIHEDGTGSIRTKINASDVSFVARNFLGFGTDAIVEEPAEVVEQIKELLEQMRELYT
jgi:predicted DNA-binding transcriptional regulator YafY